MKVLFVVALFFVGALCIHPEILNHIGYEYGYDDNDQVLEHMEKFIEQLWDMLEQDLNDYANTIQHRNGGTGGLRGKSPWEMPDLNHDTGYYAPARRIGFDYDAFINDLDHRMHNEMEGAKPVIVDTAQEPTSSRYVWFAGYALFSSFAMAFLYTYIKKKRSRAGTTLGEKVFDSYAEYETPLKSHKISFDSDQDTA